MEEAQVQHLFTLARVLIYETRRIERDRSGLLKFYCDWTMHPDIDRSGAGAHVLADVHSIIADHLHKKDNATLAAELTAALSLEKARVQFNELIRRVGGSSQLDKTKWWEIVRVVLEIIANRPLKIGLDRKLAPARSAIRSRPLRGTSVVEQLLILKVPSVAFTPNALANEFTYCILLDTSDTAKIVSPLMEAAR